MPKLELLELSEIYEKRGLTLELAKGVATQLTAHNALESHTRIEMPGMLLGIGTIKDIEQAKEYYAIGADFFISPGFVPEVSHFLQSKKKLYCPGCMTPTEIITAENVGIKFIKLFPGNILGPEFLSSIKDIFLSLNFMTTGGVHTTHTSIKS